MSSTRSSPSDEQWEAARTLVAAFSDADCRCDGITLTEGARENLKIKVAYALRQREQEVRVAERKRCWKIADERAAFNRRMAQTFKIGDPMADLKHTRADEADVIASEIRRDDTPQEGRNNRG